MWLPPGDLFVLIVFGVLVIGMVDNVLRPVLVSKDTKPPDYVVLVSTLGGMAISQSNAILISSLALLQLERSCRDSGDNYGGK
ncbi:MAG TPA: hypothetical protein VMT22_22535, partial [Terriglobales bacterium]|nr:hypothetical protein [Terriglobales bacterium]